MQPVTAGDTAVGCVKRVRFDTAQLQGSILQLLNIEFRPIFTETQ